MERASLRPDTASASALPLVVAVSGATALVYESLWMRSFGLVFGNTTDAVGMVLATFMGGLALGSLVAARRPSRRPLRTYAWVELGIGATALLTLPLLRALPRLYGALAARNALEGPLEATGRAVSAAFVILPTTLLLGATLPLVIEFLSRAGGEFHASFGRLYLANTLGGAVGVVTGAFVLVPGLGVTASFVLAALGNLTIGGLAWRWSRERPTPQAAVQRLASEGPRLAGLFAPLAFASGACSLGVEVLWTRSYVLVIGSSVYAFNLMLVAVLLGIAAGTAVYARVRSRVRRPAQLLGLLFVAMGAAVVAGQVALGWLPVVFFAAIRSLPVSFAAHQAAGFAVCLLTMLPVTLVLGLTFPLLTHLAEAESRAPQVASGLLYAWNTAGAIVGALVTDFALVRLLGLQRSYLALAALPLLAGAWALGSTLSWRPLPRAAATAGLALVLAALMPRWQLWDPLVMTAGIYKYGIEWKERPGSALRLGRDLAAERRLLFYAEGREAVVAVAERPASGRRFLSVNGKTDAGSGAEDVLTQKLIAHVPLLLHRDPRRALVIGWGAGATAASAALYPLESLECVEIEPATFEAAPLFAGLSGRLTGDPRFRIVFRDGRNHLLRTGAGYDVIVSEPSNPWISGVSNLFTREFYEIVRARLAPGGIFGQWFHYYNLRPADVKVELVTFLRVFPQVSLWLVPPVRGTDGSGQLGADLLLVGSREPHALDWPGLQRLFRETPVGEDLRGTGVFRDEMALVAVWALSRADLERYADDRLLFPAGTPLNTDDQPVIEFAAPRSNVLPPAEVVRAALAQYAALAEAGRDVSPPLRNHPGLESQGAPAAAFYRELAERYAEAALPGRALRALEAALALEPASAAAQARSGELLLERGRAAEAEARLREAVRLDPSLEKAWELLGGLYLDRQDYARAIEVHREMLRHHPRSVAARLRLGAALARAGRWREARDVLHEARALDPRAPIDPALLGFIEQQAGR